MNIVLASQNAHKKVELSHILEGHTILLPRDEGIDFDVDETGQTFLDNALIKAQHLHTLTGKPVLSDDSGLCVPALDGAPGVLSARYGSGDAEIKLTDTDRNAYLLRKLNGVADRRAYFVCSMVLLFDPTRFFIAQETVHGEITLSPQGDNGFGYDPLFFLPDYGKTVAQLPASEKNRISHRAKAALAISKFLAG